MDELYTVCDMGDDAFGHIKLNKDTKYPDVTFQFGMIKLLEEDNSLRVKFEFEVFENPNNIDTTTQEFKNYIGDNILMKNLIAELIASNKGNDD